MHPIIVHMVIGRCLSHVLTTNLIHIDCSSECRRKLPNLCHFGFTKSCLHVPRLSRKQLRGEDHSTRLGPLSLSLVSPSVCQSTITVGRRANQLHHILDISRTQIHRPLCRPSRRAQPACWSDFIGFHTRSISCVIRV